MARLAYIKSKLFIPNTPEMRRRVEKYYEFSDPVILVRQIHSFFFEWQKQKGDAESLAPVRILAIQV